MRARSHTNLHSENHQEQPFRMERATSPPLKFHVIWIHFERSLYIYPYKQGWGCRWSMTAVILYVSSVYCIFVWVVYRTVIASVVFVLNDTRTVHLFIVFFLILTGICICILTRAYQLCCIGFIYLYIYLDT